MTRTMIGYLLATALTLVGVVGLLASIRDATPAGSAAAIGILSMAVAILLVKLAGVKFHPLSLYSLFLYSHSVLFIARPLYAELFQEGRDVFTGAIHDASLIAAAAIAATGLLSISIGYLLVRMRRSVARQPPAAFPLDQQQWAVAKPLIALTVLMGVALYGVYVAQVGGLAALIELSSGRSVELTQALAGASGYFTSGLLFTLGASTLAFAQGVGRRQWIQITIGLLLLVLGTGPQLLSGSRSVFFPLAVTILVCIVRLMPGRIKPVGALLFAIPAFIALFILPRVLRQQESTSTSLADALNQAVSSEQVFEGFFGGLDTAMLDAFAKQVALQDSGALPMSGGQTYIGALGAFIPRSVWSAKPEAVDILLNQTVFPTTAARGIGFSFGIYSEPFLNFGIPGVIIVLGLFGIGLAVVDGRLFGRISTLELAIWALAAGAIFPLVRGSITFDLQRFLIPAVPLILIAWAISARSKRGSFTSTQATNRRLIGNVGEADAGARAHL